MRSGEGSTTAAAAEVKKAAAPFRLAELGLRICAVPLAVASLWEMATNKQVDETYGEVSFSNLSGFRYLVWINAITAAYSVASILLSSCKFISRFDWLIFPLDQASAYLLLTSASAAAEVVYLAREGDPGVSWGEVCSYFGRFCGAATVSVALNAAALLCFMALSLISAFRVFTKFHPPSESNSKQQLPQEQEGQLFCLEMFTAYRDPKSRGFRYLVYCTSDRGHVNKASTVSDMHRLALALSDSHSDGIQEKRQLQDDEPD